MTGGDEETRVKRAQEFQTLRKHANWPATYKGYIQNYDWGFLDPENMGGQDTSSKKFIKLKSFLEGHGYMFEQDTHGSLRFVKISTTRAS